MLLIPSLLVALQRALLAQRLVLQVVLLGRLHALAYPTTTSLARSAQCALQDPCLAQLGPARVLASTLLLLGLEALASALRATLRQALRAQSALLEHLQTLKDQQHAPLAPQVQQAFHVLAPLYAQLAVPGKRLLREVRHANVQIQTLIGASM